MSDYKYFSLDEFVCSETGEQDMCPEFLKALSHLREICGFPFIITSGFRSESHSVEKAKKNQKNPGVHTQGIACDIKISGGGAHRLAIVKHASAMGMSVGVARTFVHVDTRKTEQMCWCY